MIYQEYRIADKSKPLTRFPKVPTSFADTSTITKEVIWTR
jgi:hypothetical protein